MMFYINAAQTDNNSFQKNEVHVYYNETLNTRALF